MPKFTYTGEKTDGTAISETIEAADRFAVYEIARTKGHTVSSISEASKFSFGSFAKLDRLTYYLNRVKTDELVMATRNLSSMLNAGLVLTRSLSVIERQNKNPKLKEILKDLRERINKGDQFNVALKDYPKVFSDLYVSMVRAGEESGKLAEALHTLATQMERSSTLMKKIKGAMIYPIIVLVIMVIIGFLMMIYVMPSITGTFRKLEVDLPATTKALIAVSDFLNEYTTMSILLLVSVVVGFIYLLRTRIGKIVFHYLIVRVPVIGKMVKETNSARTARTLSSLLSSGVDIIGALKITEDVVQNIYYKEIIREAARRVEKGTPLSEVFVERSDLYPVLVGEMISVGEETGNISKMLVEVAEFYENEVEQKTKDMSTIVEPMLMVVIGASVGFFALAMIAPIYSISDGIG
jgi:type IV pilus assembly protein PilC